MSFSIEIASVPDRDGVVAEIWWDDSQVAELRRSGEGDLLIEVYAPPSGGAWSFALSAFLDALNAAQNRLA